jgi:hypothetical protein
MDRAIPASELEQLLSGVQQQCAGMERTVHGRDVREIVVSVIIVAIFAAMWPNFRTEPVTSLGIGLIILGAVLIIGVLLWSRKPAPLPFDATVLECSRNRLAWIDGQIRLLQNVVWWYVGPLTTGLLLFAWGRAGGDPVGFVVPGAFFLAVGAGVVYLNRWAVRCSLQPIREDLVRLIETLESTDGA